MLDKILAGVIKDDTGAADPPSSKAGAASNSSSPSSGGAGGIGAEVELALRRVRDEDRRQAEVDRLASAISKGQRREVAPPTSWREKLWGPLAQVEQER